MIKYGLLPVGGKANRLGGGILPFSKEMLPQKNYDYYCPIINHTVEKMLLAGVKTIVFVHSEKLKSDIVNFYNGPEYIHITQKTPSFAGVIKDFYLFFKNELNKDDSVLFGLPDTITYTDNQYSTLLNHTSIVCALFRTDKHVKVDRLLLKNKDKFEVKASKNKNNSDWFWGALKFDVSDIELMIKDKVFDETKEIGTILNKYKKTVLYFGDYIDLGTWENLNKYWSMNKNHNREIEKKYDASNVNVNNFEKILNKLAPLDIKKFTSTDYYFTCDNSLIEFVRYREGNPKIEGCESDLTIKNKSESSVNRLEISVPINKDKQNTKDIIYFLSLMGFRPKFDVKKKCSIYYFKDAVIVFYEFKYKNKKIKIIETELKKGSSFKSFDKYDNIMEEIKGFDRNNQIKKSKFKIIQEIN